MEEGAEGGDGSGRKHEDSGNDLMSMLIGAGISTSIMCRKEQLQVCPWVALLFVLQNSIHLLAQGSGRANLTESPLPNALCASGRAKPRTGWAVHFVWICSSASWSRGSGVIRPAPAELEPHRVARVEQLAHLALDRDDAKFDDEKSSNRSTQYTTFVGLGRR